MKTLNRFNLLFTICWLTMLLSGCTSDWTSQAQSIITLLGPAISSILAIISAFGLGLSPNVAEQITAWSNTAQQGLAEVKTLIDQYNAAEAAAKPGILTEIETLLQTINNNLSSILPTIKVTNPSTQAKILAIIQAFESELMALIALVPVVQGQVTDHTKAKALFAALKTDKEFKNEFNARVDAFGPEAHKYEI